MNTINEQRTDQFITLMEIIDFLPDPLLISRFGGKTHHPVYVNRKFTDMIGYTLAELPDIETWFKLAYPDDNYRREIFEAWTKLSMEAKTSGTNFVDVPACIRCKHQEDKWFNVRATFWKEDIYIVVFSNIDEINLKNQELDRLNRMKDKLFSVISHDLRSPLASLKSMVSMLDRNMMSENDLRNHLPILSMQLRNVSDLLETLLHWAKSQLHKPDPSPREFDMGLIIAQSIELLQPEARRKDIILEHRCNGQLFAWADLEMISIVIRNLIANAIKFTPRDGKISIHTSKDKDRIHVTVADTGTGMTSEQVEKILNKQAFTSLGTNNERGTGLGLLFCHEFILQNGGNLYVKSQPNVGSEFRFTVPCKKHSTAL
jgi:two-component system sensor histidine kinase/response regulator